MLVILVSMLILSMSAYFSYEINMYRFVSIATSTMDSVLVEGQLTNEAKDSLLSALSDIGMTDASSIQIEASPSAVNDGLEATYAKRGEIITLKIIYTKPHFLGNVMAFVMPGTDVNKFLIGHKMEGMSEKW